MKSDNLKILLVGNPNSGKSTVFNSLVGGRAKVGNYSGVTVDKKSGAFKLGDTVATVEDLPGLYSLSPSSSEEEIVRDILGGGEFDLIANVVDSTNLERNLFLTLQISEMRQPMVVILNMSDELEKKNKSIDADALSDMLGVPVIKSVGYDSKSAESLKDFLVSSAARKFEPKFPWAKFKNEGLYADVSELSHAFKAYLPDEFASWSRWIAIRSLEGDSFVLDKICRNSPQLGELTKKTAQKIENEFGESPLSLIAAARYSIAGEIVGNVLQETENSCSISRFSFDRIFLNKYLGLPIFAALMFLTFQFVFVLGDPMMGFMEDMFAALSEFIGGVWTTESPLRSLVLEGIIGGVGGVLVFLPNILMLFFAFALLEDSGYMARAALLCDRFMRRFGLSGASIIPMLVGFGCSVPGIMATRSLKSRSERLATIMVLPLFSCGARFPVYVLLIPAFFPSGTQGLVMFTIYIVGIVLAMLGAKVLRLTALSGADSTFIMELPPYRLPRPKNMAIQMWNRAWAFLKKAGTLILGASIILWIASTYPEKAEFSKDYEAMTASVEADSNLTAEEKTGRIGEISAEELAEKFDYTISGRVGAALEPVLSPLGFDRKISSALIGALAAKEVFVSQLGIVYGMGDEVGEDSPKLRDKIQADYTPLQGASILLFILVSMPCVATAAATYQETRSWKMVGAQLGGLTLLAYVLCLVLYQAGSFLGL